MSEETRLAYRAEYLADPWYFALDICQADKLVERFHKPLIYLYAAETALLIGVLKSSLRSAVITRIKAALKRRRLDYHNPVHFRLIDEFVHKHNIRIARKLGKTTCSCIAILFRITRNPNEAWGVVSRDDPAAYQQGMWMVRVIQSPVYRFFFPDRIPEDERSNLTQSWILLAGRTVNLPEPCVLLQGHASGWVGKHFGYGGGIRRDDMVGLENRSPERIRKVRDFEANRRGLMMPEWEEQFIDSSTGTRWSRDDDAAALDKDPDCLTIYVPIEEHKAPVTFANMLKPGTPTLPEWFDEKAIAKEKREYLKNPEEGPLALLANLHLTIIDDAAQVFHPKLVDSANWEYVEPEHEEDKRFRIARCAKDKNGEIVYKKGRAQLFIVDVRRDLELVAAGDPAASMKGDNYGVTVLGRDHFGTRYEIETISGYGAEGFLESLLYIDEKYDPPKIGIEKAAMQDWVLLTISKDERFQRIAHKFVGVTVSSQSKRYKAQNLVAAPLASGEFYLNPAPDSPTKAEMKVWDPDNPRAKDGCIDAIGIGMSLYDTPALGHSIKEIRAMVRKEIDETPLDDFGLPIENVLSEDGDYLLPFYEDFAEATWN
jgi:hypothetical protein